MENDYKTFMNLVKPVGGLNKQKKEIGAIDLILEVLKNVNKPNNDEIKSARYLHYVASLIENSGKVVWKSKTKVDKMDMLFQILQKIIERPLNEPEKKIIKEQVEFMLDLKVIKVSSVLKLILSNAKTFLCRSLL